MRCRRLVALVVLATASCTGGGGHAERTADERAALGGEIAARVGSEAIPLQVVANVAAAQNVPPGEALRRLIDDAIVASASRAEGRDRQLPASWRLIAARARFTTDELAREARSQGLPSDEEVALLTQRHWLEVDRPPAVRVVHAIILAPKDPALVPAAKSAAAALHAELVQAPDDAFDAKAKATPRESKLELRVERLPAMTEDGHVVEGGGGQMDPTFAKAAHALTTAAPTSGVVETGFGYHVIRLLDRVPEKRMPLEERRRAFAEEAIVMRARSRMDARLKALRDRHPVVISPAAEMLMRSVTISRDPPP